MLDLHFACRASEAAGCDSNRYTAIDGADTKFPAHHACTCHGSCECNARASLVRRHESRPLRATAHGRQRDYKRARQDVDFRCPSEGWPRSAVGEVRELALPAINSRS